MAKKHNSGLSNAVADAAKIVADYNALKTTDKIDRWIAIGLLLIRAKRHLRDAGGGSWLDWREIHILKKCGMYAQECDAFVAIAKAAEGHLYKGKKLAPYLDEALAWHEAETGKPVGYGHANLYKTLSAYLRQDKPAKARKPATPREQRERDAAGQDKGALAGLVESLRLRVVGLETFITDDLGATIPSFIPPMPEIPAFAGIPPDDDETDENENAESPAKTELSVADEAVMPDIPATVNDRAERVVLALPAPVAAAGAPSDAVYEAAQTMELTQSDTLADRITDENEGESSEHDDAKIIKLLEQWMELDDLPESVAAYNELMQIDGIVEICERLGEVQPEEPIQRYLADLEDVRAQDKAEWLTYINKFLPKVRKVLQRGRTYTAIDLLSEFGTKRMVAAYRKATAAAL